MQPGTIALIIGLFVFIIAGVGAIVYFVWFRKPSPPQPPNNSQLSQLMINGYMGSQKTVIVCNSCPFQNVPLNMKVKITITSVNDDIGPAKSEITDVFKNYETTASLSQGLDMNGNKTMIFLIDTPSNLSSLWHVQLNISGTYELLKKM